MADSVDSTPLPDGALPLPIAPVEGEPRIRDIDLAVRLGFAKPTKIRDLIKRHMTSLEAMGTVPTVGTVNRGQKATEFYLNRKQAIFITAKSETAEATDITIEIIERFDAYERGAVQAVPAAVAQEALSILRFIEKAGKGTDGTPPVAHKTAIIRYPEVFRRTGYHRTSLHKMEKVGKFPKRVTLGPKSVGWIESEVEAWIADRQSARSGDAPPQVLIEPPAPKAIPPKVKSAKPPEEPPPMRLDRPPLAEDVLDGAEAIAGFLGMEVSSVIRLATAHQIPAFWLSTRLLARKSSLARWFTEVEAAAFRAMAERMELETHYSGRSRSPDQQPTS